MKKLYAILIFFTLFSTSLKATHLVGGDITWVCLGNGQYQFTLRVYRDCNGFNLQMPIALRVWGHPTVDSIPLHLVSQTDISPQCNGSGPTITCAMGNMINPVLGSLEEYIFESNPITLLGIPPPQGWAFTYDNCCRNNAITNLSTPGGYGMTLRAIMYAYNGQNSTPCTDSSPVFAERPAIIICAGTPYQYNHNAYDPDQDSLHFVWGAPLDEIGGNSWDPTINFPPPIPFAGGFSINNPMPSPGNPSSANNVAASLSPTTGNVSFTSYDQGFYVTTVKVQSFRCGQLVAEIFREIQIVILDCGANFPPTVPAPFTDPNTGQPSFDTIVYAGDLINFTLSGVDLEWLPIGTQQSVTVTATGGQFGTGYTNPNAGCVAPPCATLQPPAPLQGTPGQPVTTTFNWQTDCNHIEQNGECYAATNLYTFVFKVRDDYCPAPSQNIVTVGITVLAQPTEPSPQLRCVDVQPNGDVQLSWIAIPNLVNSFDSYQLYSSTSASGPFTLIDSIFNINASTYTHVGAGANAQSRYYFIRTRSGCGGAILSPALDTLRSIYLNVTDPANGTAGVLNWNPLHIPNLPTTQPWYRIYKEYPLGTWTLIDSTQLLNYSDPLVICEDSINYRVEVSDASGCTSSSNIDGELFQNITPPNPVVIDTVSVDATGNAVIGWQPGPSTDATGYIIYVLGSAGWVVVDTVYGYNNTAYTNASSNASNVSETYAIAAFDSCGGYGNVGPSHNTMFLKAALDQCTGDAVLTWNNYVNMANGVAGYTIYQSQNGAAYTQIATTANNGYTVSGITPGVNYCYYVQAYNATGTLSSTSSTVCLSAATPGGPQYLYLNRATVLPYGGVGISCLVDTTGGALNYKLYRTDSIDGPFSFYELLLRMPGAEYVFYHDLGANTSEKIYTYYVSAIDKCGNETKVSNIGRSILLQGEANVDMTNTVRWNRYEDWDAGVGHYDLYRNVDFDTAYTLVASIPAASFFTYDDDVRAFKDGSGMFCYYIEAIENNGNSYGLKDTSRSNIICIRQSETIYIPNAFTPEGHNPIFKPQGTFIDSVGYSFVIVDRWGELLYESHKPGEGWDGSYKGKAVPEGVYVYILRYQTTENFDKQRTGTVLLFRN